MKCAVAIFAKTIGLSPVKTRLAADIGQERAEQFYRLSIACIQEVIESVVTKNPNVFPHWVLAEEDAPMRSEWSSFPALWTGEGGLGERLGNVSQKLLETHDAVLLIGTDSPQMSPKRLLEVVQTFKVSPNIQHIAGPATDGGFWLWGSNKALPIKVWRSVKYSADTTLEELIASTNDYGHSVSINSSMQDVDVLEDLATLQNTLEQEDDVRLPAQAVLLKWLQVNNPTFQV